MGYVRSGAFHIGQNPCYVKQGLWALGANSRHSHKYAYACATGIHPKMHMWLIFIRASNRGSCRGIWKPQPLFSASFHQSVWVYLLTICWCFDISSLICLNPHGTFMIRSDIPMSKDWLLLLPWACLIFSQNKCYTQGKIKKWQPQMSAGSVSLPSPECLQVLCLCLARNASSFCVSSLALNICRFCVLCLASVGEKEKSSPHS